MRVWILAAAIIALRRLRARNPAKRCSRPGMSWLPWSGREEDGACAQGGGGEIQGGESKLIEALRAGKGHPMPVDASAAELQTIVAYLQQKPAGKPKPEAAAAAAMPLDNATCLGCHGNEGFAMPGPDGRPRPLHVVRRSSSSACTRSGDASNAIPTSPRSAQADRPDPGGLHPVPRGHVEGPGRGPQKDYERLGVVVEQIDLYLKSVRAAAARPVAHQRDLLRMPRRALHLSHREHRARRLALNIPLVCGRCHEKQRDVYKNSVHGGSAAEAIRWRRSAPTATPHTTSSRSRRPRPRSRSRRTAATATSRATAPTRPTTGRFTGWATRTPPSAPTATARITCSA